MEVGLLPIFRLQKSVKWDWAEKPHMLGYFLQRVVCRPQQLPDTFDTALT